MDITGKTTGGSGVIPGIVSVPAKKGYTGDYGNTDPHSAPKGGVINPFVPTGSMGSTKGNKNPPGY
jgi:hypothetical protein